VYAPHTRSIFGLWDVADGVAGADLPGDFSANRNHACRIRRKVGFSSADRCEVLQESGFAIRVFRVIKSDRIDCGDTSFDLPKHIRVRMAAGVVAAIADDNQRFLVTAPHCQLLETFDNRIIERGFAFGPSAIESLPQFQWIVREVPPRAARGAPCR